MTSLPSVRSVTLASKRPPAPSQQRHSTAGPHTSRPQLGPNERLTRGASLACAAAAAAARSSGRRRRYASRRAVVGNTDTVVALGEPVSLWGHFAGLSSIPRPSKQEAKVLEYIREFAEARGLEWRQDSCGNLLVIRPGSGGGENAEPVLLQGHVDMVCEKNSETTHDFAADPIHLRVDGEWLRARGTTLGADNGIGVAAALAVLELGEEAKLPPLEALFTVDEETGLTGAFGLDGSMISAKRMLNLDTEEFGNVYIGCAGGGNSVLEIEAPLSAVPHGSAALEMRVRGLLGGHSGINIHEGRGNAVVMASILAADVLALVPDSRLVRIEGGDKHNAIPREALAVVAVPEEALTSAREAVATRVSALREEFGQRETELAVGVEAAEQPAEAFSASDSARILAALRSLPHGVIKMSHAIEGLVETSNNLASVQTSGGGVKIQLSTRSSLGSALEAARDRLQAIADLAGGTLARGPVYPGWAPRPKAALVGLTVSKLAARSGVEPKVLAIHAGLECGLLLEKCPSIEEAVSFGPTIVGAHSPDEALEICTVQPFFEALLDILGDLAMPPSSRL